MHVLHFVSYYNTSDLYRHLFQQLVSLRCEQTVVSPRGIDNPHLEIVRYIGKKIWGPADRVLFDLKIRKYCHFVRGSVLHEVPNLIHAHSLYSDGFAACKIARELNIPYVVTVRSTDIYKFAKYYKYLNRKARRVLDEAAGIVFLNKSYVEKLNIVLGIEINSSKIRVIPNGIDSYWFSEYPQRNENTKKSLTVVTVGKVIPRKNQKSIIDAVNDVNAQGGSVQLLIVGEIESFYGKRLKRKYESSNIVFLGQKPREQIKSIFSRADLFVLLSKVETFGLVYAEALSQGLPVVVSSGQGFDGWFESVNWCRSIRYSAVSSLAEIIEEQKCLTHPNHSAVESSREMFNWESVATRIYDLYCNVQTQ